jgi:hypothetical protein
MSVLGGAARLEWCRSSEGFAGWAGALLQHRRRAVGKRIAFGGLDVHEATITACLAEAGRNVNPDLAATECTGTA